MTLPIPNLDDRRFEELVREALDRVAAHTPDWSRPQPGDPGVALVELFAWLTETILYRANLIPLRQRRAFLNLLRIPLRPALPARGFVSIDAPLEPLPDGSARLPDAIAAGAAVVEGGGIAFTSLADVQPSWLAMVALAKRPYRDPDRAREARVREQLRRFYAPTGRMPTPFVTQKAFVPGVPLRLDQTVDRAIHLGFVAPARARGITIDAAALRRALAGRVLCVGLAPPDDVPGDIAREPAPRTLRFELVHAGGANRPIATTPLEIVTDASAGGRRPGVVRLRLPATLDALGPPTIDDAAHPEFGRGPPDLPPENTNDLALFWIRLTCREDPRATFAHAAVNAVDVTARIVERDLSIGVGDGTPDQAFKLSHAPVDPGSVQIEVWEAAGREGWSPVADFGGQARDAPVYVLDPAEGTVRFGDGLNGRRVPARALVVARRYAHGGGAAGNLPAGTVKAVRTPAGNLKARQDWPLAGGADEESVEAAERRIPAALNSRDRAVTREDFGVVAAQTPGLEIARVEVVPGLVPGATLAAARTDVPGAVGVFVLPPAERRIANAPRPTAGMLREVFNHLRERTLIGTELYALSPRFVPVAVNVAVKLIDAAAEVETKRAVEAAIVDYLWSLPPGGPRRGGWPLAAAVDPDELLTQAARVPNVLSAEEIALFAFEQGAWRRRPPRVAFEIGRFALPDLRGVACSIGERAPDTPPGEVAEADDERLVPVSPEMC